MSRKLCIATLMVLGGFVAARPAWGQTSQIRGDGYLLATGKTYLHHAYDHARILKNYASTGEAVPSDVVMEHATAMKAGLTLAGKSYGKLSSAVTSDPEAGKRVAELQNRLNLLSDQVDQLEAACAKQSAVDSAKVTTLTSQISQALKANRVSHDQAYQAVTPSEGASWYTDGSFDE
jgi:uncharacterized small protein (DUF1192 family)